MFRSRLRWLGSVCTALAFVCGLAALVGLARPETTNAQETNFGWQKVENTPAGTDFTNVFMISGRFGGLVAGRQGDQGVLYELNITPLDAWRNSITLTPASPTNFRAPLNAAVLVDDNNIWVVGDKGLIAHKTSSGWAEVPNPVPDANLTSLQMLGAGDEGLAAGYRPTPDGSSDPVLLHYSHGRWEQDNSITGKGPIRSLHFAEGGGWAVGQPGIWHYRNGAWAREQEPEVCPGPNCFSGYFSVRAIDQDQAWVAGDRISNCGICVPVPYLLHRVSGRWQNVLGVSDILSDTTHPGWGREFHGITFADPGHGWAVGVVRTPVELKPCIAYYDASNVGTGGRWTFTRLPEATGQLQNVISVDANHAVAVGTNGLVLTFGYGPQPPPTLTLRRAHPGSTTVTPL